MKEKIKEIFGYNDYKEFNESGNIILYSNLSFAQCNQTKGKRVEYIYDENNRLIKEIIEIRNYYDHTSAYEVFEKKIEYNEFGYRISKSKTKLIHNFHSDPNRTSINSLKNDLKRYPVDVNDLMSIVDIKLKNNKIVFKKSTDLLNNTIILEEYKYENKKIIDEKITDFQNNTISQTINEYENDLIKSTKKYSSKINEVKALHTETKYQYDNGLIVSIKKYTTKNDNLELDFETRYKYDNQNRISEEVKGNFEEKEYFSAIDYYYSTEWNYHHNCDCEKIIKLEFGYYNQENNQMLVENVSINTFNSENQCVNKVQINTDYGRGYDFYRCFNSENKYLTTNDMRLNELEFDDIKRIITGDSITTKVENIEYAHLSLHGESCMIKKTMIDLSEYDVEIVGSETYKYYLNS